VAACDQAVRHRLAFDHNTILGAPSSACRKVEPRCAFLLPEPFTLPQLQRVYGQCWADRWTRAFHRHAGCGLLGRSRHGLGATRPAMGYRLRERDRATVFTPVQVGGVSRAAAWSCHLARTEQHHGRNGEPGAGAGADPMWRSIIANHTQTFDCGDRPTTRPALRPNARMAAPKATDRQDPLHGLRLVRGSVSPACAVEHWKSPLTTMRRLHRRVRWECRSTRSRWAYTRSRRFALSPRRWGRRRIFCATASNVCYVQQDASATLCGAPQTENPMTTVTRTPPSC
jgi:hypothetical protein